MDSTQVMMQNYTAIFVSVMIKCLNLRAIRSPHLKNHKLRKLRV